jgi:flavin reductase ActVB
MINKVVTVDSDLFREFLSRFASGVTVVTTRDGHGEPWGFTSSSFASLSADPQYILVCLSRTAECFDAFEDCDEFVVNILHAGQQDTAMVFATRGSDKFGTTVTSDTPAGSPIVSGSLGSLVCKRAHSLDGGDHIILIGEAKDAVIGEGEPMLYYNRGFRELA